MDQIFGYVKPELLIVAVVLYFLGMWLKQISFIKDKYIPLILGIAGILFCSIWLVSTTTFSTGQDIGIVIFSSITQGILVAGLSTYVNQIWKQLNKKE